MPPAISQLTTILLLFLFFLLSPSTRAQRFVYPPTIPLAVRSPYLNCWLQYSNSFTAFRPTTFNQSEILGWTVLVRVDNQTYLFLGDVDPNLINGTVNSTIITVGPSSTIIGGLAGPMEVNLTFLNPIEPQDWVKQSIPFSYMSFTAKSSDNSSHYVQVYSDISGEWLSGDRTQKMLWNMTLDSSAIYYNVTLQSPAEFTEILDRPEWGSLYFAIPNGAYGTRRPQSGSDADCRGNFTQNGELRIQNDHGRPISDGLTVFALAYELYNISVTQAPVVWAIGYTTDLVINYTDLSGAPPTPRSPYYKTRYSNDEEMLDDFLNDFNDASSRAQQLDEKILQDAESVAPYLSSLNSLAIAEVYGSMELTVWTDGHGNLNKSDVMMFMKNIGGVEKNRVNAVETLYAAFPAVMYIDPALGAPLLEPLFRLQASRNYIVGYAAVDLGSNYPSVSGSNSHHDQGVEQTGNMLIMTYAYSRASGDGSLISRYYSVLTTWADYLIGSTLFIHDQSSADNLTVSNQTNLAIKGIIAIEAMSKMSSVVKQTADTNKYSNEAARLYAQWKSLAIGSDGHILATYGQSNSWTLGYNLFADVWLQTNLVDSSVYIGHSNFINNLVSNSNFSYYGMPIDSADTSAAVSSWSLFAAAMSTNPDLRTELISRVHNATLQGMTRVSEDINPAFAISYDTANGTSLRGVSSPALGALFAPLALNVPPQTINLNGLPGNMNVEPSRKMNIGAIVGGVIGGVAAVFVVINITARVQRRWRRRARARPHSTLTFSTNFRDAGPEMIVTPFDPYGHEAAQDSRMFAEQQPLVSEGPDAEMVSRHHLSSTPPTILPFPEPGTPVPIGLSDKEIARLRAEGNNSQQSRNLGVSSSSVPEEEMVTLHHQHSMPPAAIPFPQPGTPVPVGLSDKEIARLRAEGFNSHQSGNPGVSSSNVLQSTSAPDAVPESREAPYDPQRLHSEVENLVRREMQRLRAEGLVVGAPPSYTEGGG